VSTSSVTVRVGVVYVVVVTSVCTSEVEVRMVVLTNVVPSSTVEVTFAVTSTNWVVAFESVLTDAGRVVDFVCLTVVTIVAVFVVDTTLVGVCVLVYFVTVLIFR
jgi:hypothetical protein